MSIQGASPASPPPTSSDAPPRSGRVALAWLDDDAVTPRSTSRDLVAAAAPYATVSASLLPSAPPRRRVRPAAVAVPILGVVALSGAYVAAALLWPLDAVAPRVDPVEIPSLTSPATAVEWPDDGTGAVGVASASATDGVVAVASSSEAVPMASITKLITVLMVLDERPLSLGEQGPSYLFDGSDQGNYYDYLASDESALDVPVDESLTEYQLLQGILIGSAGNYVERLVNEIWGDEATFVQAAAPWLAAHGLGGLTVVDATGFNPENVGDPASLIALGQLALAHPVVAEIVRTPSVDLPGAGEVENTNPLISDPAVVGIKTGSLDDYYNLLAAKDVTIDGSTVRVYAAALGQPTTRDRRIETARLLDEAAMEASHPRIVPAGTIAGTVTTLWGASAELVTEDNLSTFLWNGATATVGTELSLGTARTEGDAAGTARLTGPLGEDTTTVRLTATLPDPDGWWRLTHPLQLFGLSG